MLIGLLNEEYTYIYSPMYTVLYPTFSGGNEVSVSLMNNKTLSAYNNIFSAVKLKSHSIRLRSNGTGQSFKGQVGKQG